MAPDSLAKLFADKLLKPEFSVTFSVDKTFVNFNGRPAVIMASLRGTKKLALALHVFNIVTKFMPSFYALVAFLREV